MPFFQNKQPPGKRFQEILFGENVTLRDKSLLLKTAFPSRKVIKNNSYTGIPGIFWLSLSEKDPMVPPGYISPAISFSFFDFLYKTKRIKSGTPVIRTKMCIMPPHSL